MRVVDVVVDIVDVVEVVVFEEDVVVSNVDVFVVVVEVLVVEVVVDTESDVLVVVILLVVIVVVANGVDITVVDREVLDCLVVSLRKDVLIAAVVEPNFPPFLAIQSRTILVFTSSIKLELRTKPMRLLSDKSRRLFDSDNFSRLASM